MDTGVFVRYLATGHDPVSDGEERQSDGDTQNRQTLHSDGLLSQTRQILIPDGQKLLLAVWMSYKLKHTNTEMKNMTINYNMKSTVSVGEKNHQNSVKLS